MAISWKGQTLINIVLFLNVDEDLVAAHFGFEFDLDKVLVTIQLFIKRSQLFDDQIDISSGIVNKLGGLHSHSQSAWGLQFVLVHQIIAEICAHLTELYVLVKLRTGWLLEMTKFWFKL